MSITIGSWGTPALLSLIFMVWATGGDDPTGAIILSLIAWLIWSLFR